MTFELQDIGDTSCQARFRLSRHVNQLQRTPKRPQISISLLIRRLLAAEQLPWSKHIHTMNNLHQAIRSTSNPLHEVDHSLYTYLRVAFSAASPYVTRPWAIVSAIHPALFHVGAAGWLQIFAVPRDVWASVGGRILSALVRANGVMTVDLMRTKGEETTGEGL
ncbi:hypothetical protein BV25DRAFT_1830354 [Artomyces pyxidatus]|uniref:Uncharacterized protein n=1 Tax=Artomyces pyxidatus TaxID=48021 RepID=A0ACB8SPQ8_9AGAM|nr:hypothetical protein BV25DRAFT_1830354 [Artomyces pyxidatus]